MKTLHTLTAILLAASLPAFAEEKSDAKPAAPAAEPAKPAEGDPKPQKPKQSPEDRFKKLDKDGDGKLSIDEFRGKKTADEAQEEFKKLDANGDGSISLEEYLAGADKKKKKKDK